MVRNGKYMSNVHCGPLPNPAHVYMENHPSEREKKVHKYFKVDEEGCRQGTSRVHVGSSSTDPFHKFHALN